ncbi:hypothetical protein HDU81_001977 [Chytriomyces hyalinus]|nr:hypothetical protein HDU81_001977 [Chytriomyces hyalinus]
MGLACCKPEAIDFTQDVELKHFELQTAIGKGAFGKVKLVQHKNTKEKYALKYIDKKMCVEMKAVDCIIQERFLLEDVHSTFICNLRYAFQDDENMFMVIDLALGGDLRYLLNTKGPLSEDLVRFYMAESALGIKYLHSQSIVHRDLKPDNSLAVLISEKGHVLLTDFNIATRFKPDKPMKSEAGSPAYMAPEMFFRKGYNCPIDWWSLGVIQYELLFGKRPFESNSSDGLKKAIMNDEITFKGTREIASDTQDAIKSFLCRDPTKRLGSRDNKVREHAYFKVLDWTLLPKLEVTPPFIPDTKNINCDFTHELEEILVNDNPLVAKARKPGEKKYAHLGEEIAKEYEKMETQFLNYDFTKPGQRKEEKEAIKRSNRNLHDEEGQQDSSIVVSPTPAGATLLHSGKSELADTPENAVAPDAAVVGDAVKDVVPSSGEGSNDTPVMQKEENAAPVVE